MSTWNDKRLEEGSARVDQRFDKVEVEMRDGFARVDKRFEKVEGEMKDGFAQTVTRGEMNERFTAVDKRLGDLTRWVQALVVVVGGAIVSNGLPG